MVDVKCSDGNTTINVVEIRAGKQDDEVTESTPLITKIYHGKLNRVFYFSFMVERSTFLDALHVLYTLYFGFHNYYCVKDAFCYSHNIMAGHLHSLIMVGLDEDARNSFQMNA